MKQERIEVLNKVFDRKLTPAQADGLLSELLKSELTSLSDKIEKGESRWSLSYEDATPGAQREMEGYQWALNDVSEII
jgi:hypothetical protein